MSRGKGRPANQVLGGQNQPVERVPYAVVWIRKILRWSRLRRIVTVAIFSVAATTAIFPLVDRIYLTQFYNESTRMIPSFVSVSVGIIVYGVGWFLLVGTRGEQRPERIAVLLYVIAGILIVLFVLSLILGGYTVATMPDA